MRGIVKYCDSFAGKYGFATPPTLQFFGGAERLKYPLPQSNGSESQPLMTAAILWRCESPFMQLLLI
ncbi:hypothetical protein HMPREF9080_01774 [Cardiobacterium valvarum F0432]|uniref:Uncharacterized protein n=1 Tax=Cardiobacterium valvarum F0432 TaxID=797473 RepID=G9ZG60_9GAMM|nr:hypothetical protein [Cardiobacterium valvarum]EHM53416.1 hypothetical protein HMPREF9080_01774 [Cardiobacterium valvarum F0432]